MSWAHDSRLTTSAVVEVGHYDHLIGRALDCLILIGESDSLPACHDLAVATRRLLERRIDARRCPN